MGKFKLVFKYQQGSGGGLVKTECHIFTCPGDDLLLLSNNSLMKLGLHT